MIFGPGPIRRDPAANVSNSKNGDGWRFRPHIVGCATTQLTTFSVFGASWLHHGWCLLQHQATAGSLNDRFAIISTTVGLPLSVARPLVIRNQTCPEDLGCHPALLLVHSSHLTLRRLVIGGDESRRPARHRTGLVRSREQGAGEPQ